MHKWGPACAYTVARAPQALSRPALHYRAQPRRGICSLKVNVEVNLGKRFSKHFLQVSSLTPFGILLFVCFVSFVDW